MRTIYDYKDLRKLESSSIADELNQGIIVTATAALAQAMKGYYPNYLVLDIHELITGLIPEWEENTKDIHNYISLRNVMEDYFVENEDDDRVIQSFHRNAYDIWNAILLLIEAEVYPQDIPDAVSMPIRHFKNIWTKLEADNAAIMSFRTQFLFRLSDVTNVKKSVEDVLKESSDKLVEDSLDRPFYLLGFYFITPIQARIIDILEKVGYKIAYLNCYDKTYPDANEIWRKTFSAEYEEGVTVDIQPDIDFKNLFGDVLNDEVVENFVETKKYQSIFDFAQGIKKPIEEGAVIYTPDPRACEKVLREYYPEYFEKKHLLSYPVGQYIYYLHAMWNSIHQRLEMRFDDVFKCFATGWVEYDSINGRGYLSELKDLEVFFEDCVTFEAVDGKDGWIERFAKLKEAKRCLEVFEIPEEGNKRWHELMGNPFKKMSVYNVPINKLDEIEQLLSKLMKDAKFLFEGDGKTSLFDHFNKIAKILREQMDREDIQEEESVIIAELLESLNKASTQDIECPLNTVKEAILLLIGDHRDDVDILDEGKELYANAVAPFSMVEASILSNYGQEIHLVLADELTLPGKPKQLPWPLSMGLINSLDISEREDTVRYVEDMCSVINNKPLSYRYLFYSLLSNYNQENHPKICISWITKQRNRKIGASPYVLFLDETVNDSREISYTKNLEKEIADIKLTLHEIESDAFKPGYGTPVEVQMDYHYCKYRYLFSYILGYLPSFKDKFHYSFLLTNMIKAFQAESGKTREEVSKEVYDLFPFLRNIEKQQAVDFVGRTARKDPEVFNDAEYPYSRLWIHYLNARQLELAETINEDNTKKCTFEEEIEMCRYCPFLSMCRYKTTDR